jgi:hypothetical protein
LPPLSLSLSLSLLLLSSLSLSLSLLSSSSSLSSIGGMIGFSVTVAESLSVTSSLVTTVAVLINGNSVPSGIV